ncbi:serine hydrolase [Arthrobacter sp. 35W]|uniref:serine hydrolase n=1 Tax=Arthrobacter sp. 35W TaxID=1132441 RepID=UPI00055370E9|nr:serine hydrolase [Arthrobacter sp. 35W]
MSNLPLSKRRNTPLVLGVWLAAALALGGCIPEDSGSQGPASTTGATTAPLITGNPGLVAGVPIPDGQIDAAVAKLPDLVKSIMASTNIPGLSVAVVHEGKTVAAAGYGVRKVGEDAAVDADTVFQLASLSKSVGSTVVASEVAKGAVAWNTPLQANLPGFTLSDPWIGSHVTIADMYTHRSGLGDHVGDDLEEVGFDQSQILSRLQYAPLDGFRTIDHYTNFGLTAAAESVAAAAKTDWATLSERDIYAPLGMASTSSRFADFMARPNRASGHVLVDGAYQARYQRQPDAQSPAGGVSSSANDMAKWMSMVLDGGSFNGQPVVDPAALSPALTSQFVSSPATSPDARASYTGYGFNVSNQPTGRTMLSHSGAFALGAGTTFAMLPSEKLGIVVLTNAAPLGAAETVAASFMDLVQYGEPRFDWFALYKPGFAAMAAPFGSLVGQTAPTAPAPALPDAELVGSYANSYFGTAEVTVRDGGLAVVLGPAGVVYPLTHWDGNTFSTPLASENAEPGSISKVEFTAGADGRASSLVFEYFDKGGLGTFTR